MIKFCLEVTLRKTIKHAFSICFGSYLYRNLLSKGIKSFMWDLARAATWAELIRLTLLNRSVFQRFSVETRQLLGPVLTGARITAHYHTDAFSTVPAWFETSWKSWLTKTTENGFLQWNTKNLTNQKRLIPIVHDLNVLKQGLPRQLWRDCCWWKQIWIHPYDRVNLPHSTTPVFLLDLLYGSVSQGLGTIKLAEMDIDRGLDSPI